jgi:alpha-galactosidase
MKLNISDLQSAKLLHAEQIKIELPETAIRYYRHGWQSWSLTSWVDLSHPLLIQKPYILHPYQTDAVYSLEQDPHGSWLGAAEFTNGKILFLGALSTDTHVFLKGDQLEGRSEAGEAEWFCAYGNEDQLFSEYTALLSRRFGATRKPVSPRVWCSWYGFYSFINEKNIKQTIDLLGDLSFDVIQIDDGWQKDIGDWEPNEKFPSGMTAMAEMIKSTGRTAGLWLAPLLISRNSRLFANHEDWVVKDEKGKYVTTGFNVWGHDIYTLDVTHPDVISWLVDLMSRVRRWGFDYIKMDFLYGGAMKGKRHISIPRELAFRETFGKMRKALGDDAYLLACGVPILPALGMCDAIRVGPDVSHKWEDHLFESFLQNFSTPSARNGIRTVSNRLWLKPLVHVDPDVEYFVEKENELEEEHKSQLIDLALVCEFKATGDLPQWMTSDERIKIQEFLTAQPKIEKVGRYAYKIDGRVADFTEAVELAPPPKGFASLLRDFIGWAGNFKVIFNLFLALDNAEKKRRIGKHHLD